MKDSPIKSTKIYTSDEYMRLICNSYDGGVLTVNELEATLEDGYNSCLWNSPLWNYPIEELEHIIHLEYDVVLVEFPTDTDGIYEYRWCEVAEEVFD